MGIVTCHLVPILFAFGLIFSLFLLRSLSPPPPPKVQQFTWVIINRLQYISSWYLFPCRDAGRKKKKASLAKNMLTSLGAKVSQMALKQCFSFSSFSAWKHVWVSCIISGQWTACFRSSNCVYSLVLVFLPNEECHSALFTFRSQNN